MANVDITSEIVIERPLVDVALYASNPDHVSEWYVNISSVEWLTPRPAVLGSQMKFVARFLGRRLEYTYEVVELIPHEKMVMRTAEGPFPMQTTYMWEAINENQTRMRLNNSGLPTGFASLAAPLLGRMIRQANVKDLALLKQVLEGQN